MQINCQFFRKKFANRNRCLHFHDIRNDVIIQFSTHINENEVLRSTGGFVLRLYNITVYTRTVKMLIAENANNLLANTKVYIYIVFRDESTRASRKSLLGFYFCICFRAYVNCVSLRIVFPKMENIFNRLSSYRVYALSNITK